MITRRFFNVPNTGWGNPFDELDKMSRRMEQLSSALMRRPSLRYLPSRVFPAVNITEDSNNYYLRSELPGIKADNLNIEANGRNLTISGKREIKPEGEDVKYHRREREAGTFSRVIEFPRDVNTEEINAKMANGILTVTLAKSEAAKPRQITVH